MPQATLNKSSLNASGASDADSTMQSFSMDPSAASQHIGAAASSQVAPPSTASSAAGAQAAAVHSVTGGAALQDVMPYARGDKPDFYQSEFGNCLIGPVSSTNVNKDRFFEVLDNVCKYK